MPPRKAAASRARPQMSIMMSLQAAAVPSAPPSSPPVSTPLPSTPLVVDETPLSDHTEFGKKAVG